MSDDLPLSEAFLWLTQWVDEIVGSWAEANRSITDLNETMRIAETKRGSRRWTANYD